MKISKLIPLCLAIIMLALTACEKDDDQYELRKKNNIRGAEEPIISNSCEVPNVVSEELAPIDFESSNIPNPCYDLSYSPGSNWDVFILVETFCPDYRIELVNGFGQVVYYYSLADSACHIFGLNATHLKVNECGNHYIVIYDGLGNVVEQTATFYLGFSNPMLC